MPYRRITHLQALTGYLETVPKNDPQIYSEMARAQGLKDLEHRQELTGPTVCRSILCTMATLPEDDIDTCLLTPSHPTTPNNSSGSLSPIPLHSHDPMAKLGATINPAPANHGNGAGQLTPGLRRGITATGSTIPLGYPMNASRYLFHPDWDQYILVHLTTREVFGFYASRACAFLTLDAAPHASERRSDLVTPGGYETFVRIMNIENAHWNHHTRNQDGTWIAISPNPGCDTLRIEYPSSSTVEDVAEVKNAFGSDRDGGIKPIDQDNLGAGPQAMFDEKKSCMKTHREDMKGNISSHVFTAPIDGEGQMSDSGKSLERGM
ncbi:hypothetical protein M378DRAFT_296359 [Amanita muscaria Koide BX008]|uniref:Uncharacterized protein n=1 Tax=Amanita muscaria (strain Koide BX008) TaxID=946122 RepID=A0A0C2XCP3_AMAMK|nr:hypothetical protein M378DRAFT_296359 [Amanita muscaria Koide BX008]